MNESQGDRVRDTAELIERFLDEARDQVNELRAADDARGQLGIEDLTANVTTLVRLLERLQSVTELDTTQTDGHARDRAYLVRAGWSLVDTMREMIHRLRAGRA